MTYAQYFTSFAVISVLVTAALVFAAARGVKALLLVAFLLMAAAVAYYATRAHVTGGPSVFPSSVVAIVALIVGAVIVYWRRNSRTTGGRLASGFLAWLGIVFAWFETAYLLR